jgi:hypothetical protein
MVKAQSLFTISTQKDFAAQAAKLQEAAEAALKAIGGTLTFKIVKTRNAITSIDMSDGVEVEISEGLATFLRIKTHLHSSNTNELAWVVCDLVSETRIGERSIRLLTPTPIRVTTDTKVGREYVGVQVKKFSLVDLKLVTNLSTMEKFDGPYELLVVLHFVPRKKRKCSCSDGGNSKIVKIEGGCHSEL